MATRQFPILNFPILNRPVGPNPELAEVVSRLGQYSNSTPSHVTKHGRLRGLIKSCSYLPLESALHGGVYVLSLNSDIFSRFRLYLHLLYLFLYVFHRTLMLCSVIIRKKLQLIFFIGRERI